jgi:hypothetical protein
MDVVLDANVLIADAWLRSQRFRLLLEYLKRTRSRLILFAPIEMEVRAHLRRQVEKASEDILSALRSGGRIGLVGLPEFPTGGLVASTIEAWDKTFDETLHPYVQRVPTNNDILPEALRRAIERIPPCTSTGKEMRDTIIWLSLLAHVGQMPSGSELAFISTNTSDFAAPDKVSLRQELLQDIETLPASINYFPDLDAFAKAHSDRIAHITLEWVREHLQITELERSIARFLEDSDAEIYFRISNSDYADFYEPGTVELIYEPRVTVDDVFVWRTQEDVIEIRLECSVIVEAEVECARIASPPWHRSGVGYGYGYTSDDWPSAKGLTCFSELSVTASATIRHDRVSQLKLEEIDLA